MNDICMYVGMRGNGLTEGNIRSVSGLLCFKREDEELLAPPKRVIIIISD